jgi:hypothetical protein
MDGSFVEGRMDDLGLRLINARENGGFREAVGNALVKRCQSLSGYWPAVTVV